MQIQTNVSLLPFNTFRINVNAKYFVEVKSIVELQEVLASDICKENKIFVLGGGSNLLLTKDFEGLVIRLGIKGITVCEQDGEVFVEGRAAEVWNDFVSYCVDKDFAGLENLTLIPGTVGAAPVQNIGAYGVEIKDAFHSLLAVEIKTGTLKSFSLAECNFEYRDSVFKSALKNQYIIVSVVFKLQKNAELKLTYGAIQEELKNRGIINPTIKQVSEVVASIRVAKLPDPSTIGNSGSFFKNPVVSKDTFQQLILAFPNMVNFTMPNDTYKLAAGWLIEQCGWKGKQIGNAGTWKNQALVLVNCGGASGQEIYDFSSLIIQSVKEKFGVTLEREVNIL
jgi:UDP-N-acetylmuramate dehydrogenase